MNGYTVEEEPSWYDVSIAGMRFNIASRRGESHIREVERILSETYSEVSSRLESQSPLNIALLTALNLADQLLSQRQGREGADQATQDRINSLVERLGSALDGPRHVEIE